MNDNLSAEKARFGESWDVSIDTTIVGLERCMRALLTTGSTMTSSICRGPMGRGVSADLRVNIPAGREGTFCDLCRPITMRGAPRACVGTQAPSDDVDRAIGPAGEGEQ